MAAAHLFCHAAVYIASRFSCGLGLGLSLGLGIGFVFLILGGASPQDEEKTKPMPMPRPRLRPRPRPQENLAKTYIQPPRPKNGVRQKKRKKQSVSQTIDLVMTSQTVQELSKSELSSRFLGRLKFPPPQKKNRDPLGNFLYYGTFNPGFNPSYKCTNPN